MFGEEEDGEDSENDSRSTLPRVKSGCYIARDGDYFASEEEDAVLGFED